MARDERRFTQLQYAAHAKFQELYPEWLDQALIAMRPWNEQEVFLTTMIAQAMKDAYEMGRRGEYPNQVDWKKAQPGELPLNPVLRMPPRGRPIEPMTKPKPPIKTRTRP